MEYRIISSEYLVNIENQVNKLIRDKEVLEVQFSVCRNRKGSVEYSVLVKMEEAKEDNKYEIWINDENIDWKLEGSIEDYLRNTKRELVDIKICVASADDEYACTYALVLSRKKRG